MKAFPSSTSTSMVRSSWGFFGAGGFAGHAPVEEALDEVDLVADGVVAPDLALHGLGGAAAVERDHRVPATGVGGGQVLDEAGDFEAGAGRDVGPSAQDGLQR